MIKLAYKETFKLIKKRKWLFIGLLFLQLFIFGAFTVSSYLTIVPFSEKAQSVFEYVSTIEMESLESMAQFGDDPLQFYYDLQDALGFLKQFVIFSLLILLVLNNLNWGLVNHMIKKRNIAEFGKYLFNFLVINGAGYAILFLFGTELIKALLNDNNVLALFFGVIILLVYYFMYVFIACIDKLNLNKIIERFLNVLYNKKVIFAMLINLVLIISAALLFYFTVELSLVLVFLTVVIFTFVFVWTKLFLVLTVDKA